MSKSFLAQIERTFYEKPDETQVEFNIQQNPFKDTKRLSNARLIRTENIFPDPNQPRKDFKEEALRELADSIANHGLLQPIAVEAAEDGKFKVIVGERRYRACRLVGLAEIPCFVLSPENSKDRFAKQLVENFIREDLNPIEKAYALIEYKDILGEGSKWEDVERSLGISDTRRKQFIRLLNLPEEMQNQIVLRSRIEHEAQITEGHARALLLLNSHPEEQRNLFNELTSPENKISSNEALRIARDIRDKLSRGIEKPQKLSFTYKNREELINFLKSKLAELEGNNVPPEEHNFSINPVA
ncbi:MAG: ParB/RepB/Spo0J family partition protein [Ignavibacteriales bacterium]